MKTFRVYLKDGRSFTIEAERFERALLNVHHSSVGCQGFNFYTSEGQDVDPDFYLDAEVVAAILPEAKLGN